MARIKGTAILDAIKAIQKRAGKGELDRILEAASADTKRLFTGPIEEWGWYSLDAFVDFLEADIRVTADGNREVMVARSEKVIESQLHGIYRIFVKLGSPAFVIHRIATIHATYFEGIEIIPEFEGGRKVVIKYVGIRKQHEILGYTIIGFYRKALEICGAKHVDAKFTVPISDGGPYSELTITWA